MKKIGLIGGLSPESTGHYYQIICREYNREFGGLNFPELMIESLNLQVLVERFEVNDWGGVATILLQALDRLQRAGAEFAAILANTPHNAYELIRGESPLPILTIMDATAAALVTELTQREEDVVLYRRLATLRRDVPLSEGLGALEWRGARRGDLEALCRELGDERLPGRPARFRED